MRFLDFLRSQSGALGISALRLGLGTNKAAGGGGGNPTSETITDESANSLTDESGNNLESSGA